MTYRERHGHERTRVAGRDPRKEARRQRAMEREARHVCSETCRRFRLGRAEFPAAAWARARER